MKHVVFKVALNTIGMISFALGVLGIFLPLLPTTPLLLLAAFCFARGSDRMYEWLISHRLFGSYIRSYREYQAVTIQTKIIAITLLWLAMGTTLLFAVKHEGLQVILLAIASGVTVYLLSLKTLTEEMKAAGPKGHHRGHGKKRRR